MGLIIKDKIQQLMIGYPTVSDKYDVLPAVLDGSNPVAFGDVVVLSSTAGYVTKPTTITAASQVAGFVVATNVQLANEWPGSTVTCKPGEALNLLLKGFMAVKLDSSVTIADVVPNADVYVTATGTITGSSTASAIKLDGVVFTGLYENHGTTASPEYIAEIYVK